MVDFKAAAELTKKNIASLKVNAKFEVTSGGSYNIEKGVWEGASTLLVDTPSTPPVDYRVFHKSDSSAKEGVSVVIIPGKDLKFTPQVGQWFTIGNDRWQIGAYKKHAVGDVIFAYELECSVG